MLLEKTDHLSDTIYKYQKGKHVMATPSQLVLRSDMDFEAGKREAILGVWDRQAEERKVNVRRNAEVKKITGQKGDFTLDADQWRGAEGRISSILGVGTQGNPNKMRCDGGDLPHIQYSLDDPGEYFDEHITVIGSGDAGIENALGLAADPAQNNTVTILNRSAEFARAKQANVDLLDEAGKKGRVNIMCETTPTKVVPGFLFLETRDGEQKIKCDRIIARMGTSPPRKFVEDCGIQFSSEDKNAYPSLSPQFETSVPGIYVIGALAGYPLIKHCMNQGYDVVEFINGNVELKPADEPILEKKFAPLPGARSVTEWLAFFRRRVGVLNDLSMLQMREFMLDSEPIAYREGEVVFERNDPGASLFAIADGSLAVEIDPNDPSKTIPIPQGSIVGEVGLISGRKRSATVRAAAGLDRDRDPAHAGAQADGDQHLRQERDHPDRHRAAAASALRRAPRPKTSRRCSPAPRSRRCAPARRSSRKAARAMTSSSSAAARWSWRRRSAASRSSSPICRPAPMSARWRCSRAGSAPRRCAPRSSPR